MRDTIELAREAGIIDFRDAYSEQHVQAVLQDLKAFEALVRADERDRAMRENAYVQAEREACAKVCDEVGLFHEVSQGADVAFDLAAAIRNRGNT
jgi:hypothetical protein